MIEERTFQRIRQMRHFGRTLEECHAQLVSSEGLSEEEFFLSWTTALMMDEMEAA